VGICLRLDVLKPILVERIPVSLRRSYSAAEIFDELDRRPLAPSLIRIFLDLAALPSDQLMQLLRLNVRKFSGAPVRWPALSARYRNANLLQLLRACDEHRLRGIDLSGADLIGADFAAADLRGAKLRGANLRDATFVGARLDTADISGADVTNAAGLTGSHCRSLSVISGDQLTIAAGCDSGAIDIRNLGQKTSEIVHAHGGDVRKVFWDEDRQWLISVSRRGIVELPWSTGLQNSAKIRLIFDWASAAWDKAIFWYLVPDHYYIGAAEIRDSMTHWLRKKHTKAITCADYHASRKILVLGTWSGVLLLLNQEQSTLEVLNMPLSDNFGRAHWDTIWRVRFGSRHPWLASSGAGGDPTIKVWDFERRGLAWELALSEDGPIWDFVMGAGDLQLFIAPAKGPLARVTPTQQEKKSNSPFKVIRFGEPDPSDPWMKGVDIARADDSSSSQISSLALGRDNQQLASGHEDGSVALWDATTLQKIAGWKAHNATVMDITYACGDKKIASVGSDGTVAVGVCEPTDGLFGSISDRWATGGSCDGLRFAHLHTESGGQSLEEMLAHLTARCAISGKD
jgi:WD40 repeat protein